MPELCAVNLHSEEAPAANPNPMDCKEVWTLGHELSQEHPHYHPMLYSPNLWPNQALLPKFRAAVEAFYLATGQLARRVFSLFAEALGLPLDHFDEYILNSPMDSMNMNRYPSLPPDAPANQHGIGAHTDYECFTILAQGPGNVPGLEIMTEAGEWLAIPPKDGAFVINVGDFMARWSNGRFRSTVHRAINHGSKSRYSIARFCCCNFDAVVANLVSAEEAKYKPVLAGDHMLGRCEGANQANITSHVHSTRSAL